MSEAQHVSFRPFDYMVVQLKYLQRLCGFLDKEHSIMA